MGPGGDLDGSRTASRCLNPLADRAPHDRPSSAARWTGLDWTGLGQRSELGQRHGLDWSRGLQVSGLLSPSTGCPRWLAWGAYRIAPRRRAVLPPSLPPSGGRGKRSRRVGGRGCCAAVTAEYGSQRCRRPSPLPRGGTRGAGRTPPCSPYSSDAAASPDPARGRAVPVPDRRTGKERKGGGNADVRVTTGEWRMETKVDYVRECVLLSCLSVGPWCASDDEGGLTGASERASGGARERQECVMTLTCCVEIRDRRDRKVLTEPVGCLTTGRKACDSGG